MFNTIQRLTRTLLISVTVSLLTMSAVQAGKLQDSMQIKDTCGKGKLYANKLASCTAFQCQKPNFLAAMMGSLPDDAIKKMTLRERTAMKTRMTSTLKIKGFDTQGHCLTESLLSPDTRQDCAYDKAMLKRVSHYQKIVSNANHVESKNSGEMIKGKWVQKNITKVDGKVIDNPMMETMQNGACKTLLKDADQGWMSIDQMNRMAHIELTLLEHGKPVAGHVNVLNTANGKLIFDKDIAADKHLRKINIKPGKFNIEIISTNKKLAPVKFQKIKLGAGNSFTKKIEFYAITGTLKLTLKVNGKPTNMAVYMKAPQTHQWLYLKSSIFGKKPSFYFKSANIKLPETLTGKYEVFVTQVIKGFKAPANAKYKQFLLSIKNGETINKTIQFDK